MINAGFPVIEYGRGQQPREWGRRHGEAWREAIRELVAIRRGLMIEKNPRLGPANIPRLAEAQWQITRGYDQALSAELEGIAEGAGISLEEVVILNNYTDFRDIVIDDQGCTAFAVSRGGERIAGQTWDMHASAKRYVCVLRVPVAPAGEMFVFSIVGCVGMMGFHPSGQMVGVNNINTSGARPGILWPVLIRRLLATVGTAGQVRLLQEAPLTSGRSFLLADRREAAFWEVMPDLAERVGWLSPGTEGHLFHTNHCLGERARQRETAIAMASTTHERFALMERKIPQVGTFEQGWELLNDHEGYPRSICSNYQTNSQDPSVTCGGAVGDLVRGRIRMWRGDPLHDADHVVREFQCETGSGDE